ncbi:MAG: Glucose-6-P dehydrogenase subunit [Bacteroidetes bacterium]|nr:Glucose-6-P dehydrogenase subunit [Bacteroidota bacterium]
MNESQQTVLLGAPREVDVVAIERELMRLWKHASDDVGEDGSSSPVVRACSMNLVVVTDTEEAATEIGDLVGEVTLDHPSRIFLITADRRSGTPLLDAWISARCSLPVEPKQTRYQALSLRFLSLTYQQFFSGNTELTFTMPFFPR